MASMADQMAKRRRTTRSSTSWDDLPDDCWKIIIGGLGHEPHLEPISLVCKRFHAIANLIRTTLTFYSPSSVPLSQLYSRFTNLHSLHLCHPHPNLDGVVRELAASALPLQSLHLSHQTRFPREAMRLLGCSSIMRNTLTALACTRFDCLTDDDLFVVADCFAYLRRLHLDHYAFVNPDKTLTDKGICAIATKLTSLLSLVICTNDYVSHRSFEHLSANCPLLCGLKAKFGPKSRVRLDHLSSFASLSSLALDLECVNISKGALVQLSRANLKIWKLVLRRPPGGIVDGAKMCAFLKSCRPLRHLKLKHMQFSSDARPLDFVESIPNVQVLHLCDVDGLPHTILFDLLRSCPNLEEIVLALPSYDVDIVGYRLGSPIHPRLRKLVLTGVGVRDETLMLVGTICPNLESFYVGDTSEITERGMKAMMASCSNVKVCERITNYSSWKKRSGTKDSSLNKEFSP